MTIHAPQTVEREQLHELLVNLDARRYFYTKADERWLDWLWQNGFLDPIKKEDPAPNGYRPPELDYLVRMAANCPVKVVDIMLGVRITSDTRSWEVAYYFLRICRGLSAEQLARVVEKIRSERWVPLLGDFGEMEFECEGMLKKLVSAKDYKSFFVLAEAVLAVRPKEEMGQTPSFDHNPFYLGLLSLTEVFKHLATVGSEYSEQAFALTTRVLADVVAVSYGLTLPDVDFFSLALGQSDSWGKDVCELAAATKALAVHLIGNRCAESDDVRRIYKDNLASLPDSRVMWRLRLFVLSMCPRTFKDELKEIFFHLFEVDHYSDMMFGPEYEEALRQTFHVLSADDKENFVQRVIREFSQCPEGRQHYGSPILSMILPYLERKPELKELAENTGFKLDANYEPQTEVRYGRDREGKEIVPRDPITQEEFGKRAIAEIAAQLRNEWTPARLDTQSTADGYFTPRTARDVGDLLRKDMPERLQEYVDSANRFFERDVLAQHYTYEYLAGIQEAIKNHADVATDVNWDGVIRLCSAIRESGEKNPFEQEQRKLSLHDSWLAKWDDVHTAVADLLRELLTEKDGVALIDLGRYRDWIFKIIRYLLAYPIPSSENEQIAIHTVRGRAFETFVCFVLQDGKNFPQDAQIQLFDDVKELYDSIWKKESSRELMAMFGGYLPLFYFRDMDWMRKLLPRIFPEEPARKHQYTAAWEGYLAGNPYGSMFFDPAIQKLYWRGLDLPDAEYSPQQQQFSEPGARFATHLALAFIYYDEAFGFEHALFQAFWAKDNPKLHAHFVSFFGREFVFRSGTHDFFTNHPGGKKRLRDFWDWLLKNHNNPETFREFGLWINLENGIFSPGWLAPRVRETLKKSKGILEGENDLRKSSVRLAQEAPEDTFEIARLHLLEGGVHGNHQKTIMRWDLEEMWIQAFGILYRNSATKVRTETLINQLVYEGGERFWPLKEILKNSP